ncbi:hypothetical protein DPMN_020577 [Dreissena polymorpha]|uniref:DNA 3'-5' helicase n=1 Tax=Dreissena polymorpha TaxID=45954 RepID=A0A9D4SAC9_DREPO|nr:hypothetical protein DPMN_020577 [Dreissena polymorpha]
MGLNKNSEVNPTEPGSHKPYMDRSLFGCLAGHYNAIGTELETNISEPASQPASQPARQPARIRQSNNHHFHLNKLEFNSCCSLDNYSSRSHFHQDMMEVRTWGEVPTNWGTAQPDRTDVPLLAVTATATEKVCLWSWLVIQLGDTSYDGEHRSYNRVVEMFKSSTTDTTKERILNDFRAGRVSVVVATVAFGLGIDIPDVWLMVHWGAPRSILSYWQSR